LARRDPRSLRRGVLHLPSGREGFRRTQRGWCDHVEALMRAALRGYKPLTLDAERLTYCPPCHGCRPLCRSLIIQWSAAL